MAAPTVTVIMPAFNAARHIAEALASIQNQTLRDIEVIVVDDGSTDATLQEVEQFADTLNLIVIRQANGGASAARNAGIHRASGRYCAFLDADDVMLPERLAAQAELLDAHADMGLVHTDLMTFNEHGIIHWTRRSFSNPCGGMVLDCLLVDNFITTSTVMVRREQLIRAGLFNVNRRIAEDFELWLRIAERSAVGYIERPLVKYRRLAGSLSNDKLETARASLSVIEDFWRGHAEYREQHPDIYKRSLASHYATAASAALDYGQRAAGFGYLAKSLRLAPREARRWKSFVKAFVRPNRPRPRRDALACATGQA